MPDENRNEPENRGPAGEPAPEGAAALGRFIRAQRKLANLSLRQLADLTDVSNPYLSQIERGLHEPSVRVISAIARALNLSAETLLDQAGLFDDGDTPVTQRQPMRATEAAIRSDPLLTDEQKAALLSVYRSYVADRDST